MEIEVGSRWRKVMLGTEAIYKVIRVDDELVLVKVETAPGLPAGAQLRFRVDAFSDFQALEE